MKTKPKGSNRKKLIKELDTVFSLFIRMRDGHRCMMSGHLCRCGGNVQCNHLYSRSKYRLRWDEMNAVSGCAGHNQYSHYHEVEWFNLWRQLWPDRIEYLDKKKNESGKFTDWTLKIMIDEYKGKIIILESQCKNS